MDATAYRAEVDALRARIAANVREKRKEHKLTASALASVIKVHVRHLQKIEAGCVSVTLNTLVRLASGLNVDPSVLLK